MALAVACAVVVIPLYLLDANKMDILGEEHCHGLGHFGLLTTQNFEGDQAVPGELKSTHEVSVEM